MEKIQSKPKNHVEDYIEGLKEKADYTFLAEEVMSNRLSAASSILNEVIAEEVRLITILATIADDINANISDTADAYRLLNSALLNYIEARTKQITTAKNTRLMDEACLEVAIMKTNGTPLN